MDRPPSKPLDSPRQSRRRGTTPSISEATHPAPVPGSTSTPLPSIRHLHPHLPPPNSNQYFGPSDPPTYPPSSFEHPPQSGPVRYGATHAHHDPTKALETIEESDSDKHSSPPPKKRRKRQALSCTECKRRKIKCDRTQPCGPCARRGEKDKCQWHQVETNDKYVTRAEYDQLKYKVDQLESILNRISAAGNIHLQSTMVSAPSIPPGAGPSNPPYIHHGRSTSTPYGLGPEYGSDPYSVNSRPPVASLPSSSRTTLSGEINPPVTERETSSSRHYQPPHRPGSRQFRHNLGPVASAPSYGSTEGTDERSKKRSAWTQQGVRPRQSCRAVDLVRQSLLYNILLPSLFLLACILHITTTLPLLPVPLRSFPWKSLPRTTDHTHQEGYGIVGRTVTQSLPWLSPPNASEMTGSSCTPLLPPAPSDPYQTHETQPARFLGLGFITRLCVLG